MQYGKNLSTVFSGFTRARQETSCPNARTAFDFALVLAYSNTSFSTKSNNGSDKCKQTLSSAPLIAFRTASSILPPVVPFFPPSSGRFSKRARTRRNSEVTQSAKPAVLSRASARSSSRLRVGIPGVSTPAGSSVESTSITSSAGASLVRSTPIWCIDTSAILMC